VKTHARGAAGTVLFAALLGTACGGGGTARIASTTVSRPTFQPTPSPSVAAPEPLPDSGVIAPGTYATNFQPKVTFTATSSGWEVDVNGPHWLGMEFLLTDSVMATLGIIDVDKVFDREHHGKLIVAPKDLARWIARLPGLTVVAPPTPVTVGGIEGKQLDVLIGPKDVGVSPIPGVSDVGNGFFKRGMFRIIVVRVDGRDVQIAFAPDEAGSKHFDVAAGSAKELIDSITWG
jgi:hypothetical protein